MSAVTTRPAGSADTPFLMELFANSSDIPAWMFAADPRLLQFQFTAQQGGYAAQFPGATHEVILVDGEPAGQIRWTELPDEIRILDLSVLPRFRRSGAATSVYRALLAHAAARGKPAHGWVNRFNAASLAFHHRLGFTVTDETETHLLLTATGSPPD